MAFGIVTCPLLVSVANAIETILLTFSFLSYLSERQYGQVVNLQDGEGGGSILAVIVYQSNHIMLI